jgi:hypothetical protein
MTIHACSERGAEVAEAAGQQKQQKRWRLLLGQQQHTVSGQVAVTQFYHAKPAAEAATLIGILVRPGRISTASTAPVIDHCGRVSHSASTHTSTGHEAWLCP